MAACGGYGGAVTSPEKIEQFWAWWREDAARIGETLREPEGRRTAIDEVHMRLGRLGLYGDVIPRADGRDLIVGSANGDPERRIAAAHWLTHAPEDDPRFAFATFRPAQGVEQLMGVVSPGEPPLPIAAMRFAARWRVNDDRVDLDAYVGDGVRAERASQLAAAVLRSALGELEMESWVGTLTVSGFPPAGGVDLAELVAELTAEFAVRSEPQWYLYEYEKPDGAPLVVTLRRPIQPARHPFLDGCLTIRNELQVGDAEERDRLKAQILDGIPSDVLAVGTVTDQGWLTTLIYANRRSPSIGMLKARAEMLGGEFGMGWDPAWDEIRKLTHVDPKSGLRLVRTSDPRVAREG